MFATPLMQDRVIALWTTYSGTASAINRLETAPLRQQNFERLNEKLHRYGSEAKTCRTNILIRALTIAM
jgi:hypothetical protein